jgi:hypothetical protein
MQVSPLRRFHVQFTGRIFLEFSFLIYVFFIQAASGTVYVASSGGMINEQQTGV